MTKQPHREVAVLNAALELAPAERAAYLDHACAGDAALRKQVKALLQAHEQAEGFLNAPPAGLDFNRAVRVDIPLTEKPGDRIGRYKLLQQIGEGGCGVVYMAEQEEPVRRRVALKVIKLGMDTKQVIARFEAERQALALMDHPNIAKVFDAGATGVPLTRPSDTLSPTGGEGRGEGDASLSAGRPYFVMELVRGVKITEFCDENKLSTAERLKLFIQVCQAIQHAHQKGVIHRDIKPSNILVTINDGVPVPKVIDFGIAKATAGRLTDQTLFTAFEQFIGTPAYMSPEQAVMTSLDIDTRSDIYSLGVLLYELLTGRTPFDQKELLAAGLDEMRRTIQEKEPPKPSTRLSTLVQDELTTTAERRRTESPKLVHLVRGDLDWIVMKALEKDRSRRYETATGFANDIQRHLNNEPVVARPPSKLYEFQKTVRRHKFGFAATGAVLLALLLGFGISTWTAIKERQTRQRAVAAEQETATVAHFLKDLLRGVGPGVARGRDTVLLREILDETAARVGRDLTNQPTVEVNLLNVLGSVYKDLGDYTNAAAMFRRGLDICRRTVGVEHPATAQSMTLLGSALRYLGQPAEAEALLREALAIQGRLLGEEHENIADSLYVLADLLCYVGKFSEAETLSRKALAMRRKLLGDEHKDVAASLIVLGIALAPQGKYVEAESCYREALALFRKLHGDEHPATAHSISLLGVALWYQGKYAEAEELNREALAIQKKMVGDEHPNVAMALGNLGIALRPRENSKRRKSVIVKRCAFTGNGSATTIRIPCKRSITWQTCCGVNPKPPKRKGSIAKYWRFTESGGERNTFSSRAH